jgi:hypothetical protein
MSENHERFDGLCERICKETGWERLPNAIRVSWSGGRHQLVALEFFEQHGWEFVRLVSRVGPVEALDEERLLMALRVNAGLTCGAFAVMHDALVLSDTLLLQDANLSEVKASIGYLAGTADSYEKTLFGTDAY